MTFLHRTALREVVKNTGKGWFRCPLVIFHIFTLKNNQNLEVKEAKIEIIEPLKKLFNGCGSGHIHICIYARSNTDGFFFFFLLHFTDSYSYLDLPLLLGEKLQRFQRSWASWFNYIIHLKMIIMMTTL